MVFRRTHLNVWMLAALLAAGFVLVPLAHATEHLARPDAPTAVEAYCDFCHQPFVALPAMPPALLPAARVTVAPEAYVASGSFRAAIVLRPRGPPAVV